MECAYIVGFWFFFFQISSAAAMKTDNSETSTDNPNTIVKNMLSSNLSFRPNRKQCILRVNGVTIHMMLLADDVFIVLRDCVAALCIRDA